MQVLVLYFVLLDHSVRLKDCMLFDFDHLVDQCFNNADTHVIIRRLLFMIDRNQVQMDH